MANTRSILRGSAMLGAALALTACTQFDVDLRSAGNGFDTTDAAQSASAQRPYTDNRGLISYPGYQVAVARRGDTVSSVAARVGLGAEELARYNGLQPGDTLRQDEVLALPRRVAEPSAATGGTGVIMAPSDIDVSTIAGSAIDRAEASGAITPAPGQQQVGEQPVRHKVKRGETAYSVARLYNVSVKSLAEWNGLGPDLTIREGQFLLIPVAASAAPAPQVVEAPGIGSATPEPPSAAEPLPDNTKSASATTPPPSPNLGGAPASKLQMPVQGKIIREYSKKKNEGIDISVAAGSPVAAAANGTVAAITKDTEGNLILVIRHDGNLLTVYAGVDGITVKKGDKVKRGQTVGKVAAGNPSFVHFEVREGFESTDPIPYLR